MSVSEVKVSEIFEEDLQTDTFPTAVNLELFRISQVWNSEVFAEDLQTDTFPTAVN